MKRLLCLLVLLAGVFAATAVLAAGNGNANGHKRNVDDNDTVAIHGNTHPNARPENDQGPTDPSLKYERMILVLNPRNNPKDRPDQLIAQLHDPKSPLYQQWLTPEQYGKRFGISDDDLADVLAWVNRRGLTVDDIAPGRGWINITGDVGTVERAFKTSIHDYKVNGKIYHANNKDPEVPKALADHFLL